jgi:hypothetical protein
MPLALRLIAINFKKMWSGLGYVVILWAGLLLLRAAIKGVKSLGIPVLGGWLVRRLGRLEDYCAAYVSRAANAVIQPIAGWFWEVGTLARGTFIEAGNLAQTTADGFETLVARTIPRIARDIVAPVRDLARSAWNLARAIEAEIAQGTELVRDVLATLPWRIAGDFSAVFRGVATALRNVWRYVYGELTQRVDYVFDTALPRIRRDILDLRDYVRNVVDTSIAWLTVAVETLEREVYTDIKPFIDALKKGVIPAALLTAIVAALSAAWSGLFCRNTNEVGKRLCGVGSLGLDDFLAVMFTGVAIANLEQLVRLAQAVADEAFEGIQDLLEV